MSTWDKTVAIVIAIVIAIVLPIIILTLVWRGTNDKEVDTSFPVRQASFFLVTSKTPPERSVWSASWYNYSLPDAPQYSLTHLTAASRDYPKGTYVQVWTDNKIVVVRINDWVENPNVAIDLSSFAFQQLAPLYVGVIRVKIKPL